MAKKMNVDFSSVKDRGNFNPKHVAEGDYAATITKVEDAESKKDGVAQYVFTFKLDKFSQASYPYYCKIQENQLWKLRNIAIAAGLNVPKKRMAFDPNKLVGKKVGVTLIDDEYEGKMKSSIDAVFPLAELATGADSPADDDGDDGFDEDSAPQAAVAVDDDEPAEEAPKKKKDKKGKKKKDKGENLEELDVSDIA